MNTPYYLVKPGETIKDAKNKWVLNLLNILSKQLNSHRAPTFESLSATQNICQFFSDNIIWTFFKEAPGRFKYLPKPSEVREGLNEIKKDIESKTALPLSMPKMEETPSFPWPNVVIGLIMGFDDPRGISPSGMKMLGIDEAEAKYLHEGFKRLDWKNEWALEIIEKHKAFKPFSL